MTSQDRMVGRVVSSPRAAAAPPGEAACFLSAFDEAFAADIAGWVRSERELTWLAPGTQPPLTAQKVCDWGKNRDHRFLFGVESQPTPLGYAELNNMRGEPLQMWIGHFVVDPAFRGRSIGTMFAQALLACAFVRFGATNVLLVVFPDNRGAIRCYERAGMLVSGRERRYFEITGQEHVFVRMGIDQVRFQKLAAAGRILAEPPAIRPFPRPASRGAISRT